MTSSYLLLTFTTSPFNISSSQLPMTASKLLVVFGATGNQGRSLIQYTVQDPILSKEFRIRAVTRDPSKQEAQELSKLTNVEVVEGDLEDEHSVKRALQSAHTVFLATASVYDGHVEEHELTQGKTVANAAVAAGVSFIIYSSLPSIKKVSAGKYVKGGHFDSKAEVEEYIRSLPIKSAFFQPASFMTNFSTFFSPRPVGDGTFAWFNVLSPQTPLPLIDIDDTGKFVGAILADPAKWEGKTISAATEILSVEEIVQLISKKTGKTVVYTPLPTEEFHKAIPPLMRDYILEMLLYIKDFGYYGPDTKTLVTQAVAGARGNLTTFSEYLDAHPLTLD
ncbi:hypothetical protein BGZ73_003151 [Actinomortierella ambigua]|nr:hypothetical protein BGZ73_003151 [Actinomortierella ambigua]